MIIGKLSCFGFTFVNEIHAVQICIYLKAKEVRSLSFWVAHRAHRLRAQLIRFDSIRFDSIWGTVSGWSVEKTLSNLTFSLFFPSEFHSANASAAHRSRGKISVRADSRRNFAVQTHHVLIPSTSMQSTKKTRSFTRNSRTCARLLVGHRVQQAVKHKS
jgi:hypothetical protein